MTSARRAAPLFVLRTCGGHESKHWNNTLYHFLQRGFR